MSDPFYTIMFLLIGLLAGNGVWCLMHHGWGP
jgi:hypothetical protein